MKIQFQVQGLRFHFAVSDPDIVLWDLLNM